MSNRSVLSTYDDFSPLKEIIVGSAQNYTSHEREISFDTFFHENLFRSDWAYPRLKSGSTQDPQKKAIHEKYVAELNEDVEDLCKTLTDRGIRVRRPIALPSNTPTISGFGWQAAPVPALNIRDNTLIVGNEIIETPPAIRSRYLETRLLSKVFAEFFDGGAKWITMPRPVMTDSSFDPSYAKDTATTLGGPTEVIADPIPSAFDVGFEMMFDGAQCLRLGRDLVINVANENHERSFKWLQRHFGDRYRLHRIFRMSDNHIDSMLLALKPGVFLARHAGLKDLMPPSFQKWEYIVPPAPDPKSFPSYEQSDLILTSPYIDLNVLSISPSQVLVNEACHGLRSTLEKRGFEVIPVRHRHRRLFGGGFHCFTLDTYREGGLEDYT